MSDFSLRACECLYKTLIRNRDAQYECYADTNLRAPTVADSYRIDYSATSRELIPLFRFT